MNRLPRLSLPRSVAWILFICWWAVLFALSSMSPPDLPQMPPTVNDKVAHFLFFLVGAFLLAAAIRPGHQSFSGTRPVWITFLILAAIGAVDELYQKFTPGRTGADPFDWLANCLGAFVGALLAAWYFQAPKQDNAYSLGGSSTDRN